MQWFVAVINPYFIHKIVENIKKKTSLDHLLTCKQNDQMQKGRLREAEFLRSQYRQR